MVRLIIGQISALSASATVARWLPADVVAAAPDGPRRNSWLAGRIMLAVHCPEESLQALTFNHQGKPAFTRPDAPCFNISHSGDEIVLGIDAIAPVGVDIEILRPRSAWRRIARDYFGEAEVLRLLALPEDEQLSAFWHGWTLREAVLKQRGGSVWEMSTLDISPDALAAHGLHTCWHRHEARLIAVCAAHPFQLTVLTMTGD
ncbi:4'-phosphopantetheinyl transferase AcpT [Atlantibacter hermannii]|uniref:4'-phosphopantetheinyl transferase AcpT n=1 Tax=Atlantibacter hermannii TaxID=565 RepID=UPI0028A9ED0C|nr:4'-phosphopantetheinyl transferase AcpT [Atlantibacter hermannii]